MKSFRVLLPLFWSLSFAQPSFLYKATLVQAAPGKLLELIELYKNKHALDSSIGERRPFMLRHAQGDKWDLFILLPVGSYPEYFDARRLAKRQRTESIDMERRIQQLHSWREDMFVWGPSTEEVHKSFTGNSFFHIEMFIALAGKLDELYKERLMENSSQRTLQRPENLVFVRDHGAAWDLFTIGAFRDLKHYAESADITEKEQDIAAKSAGFESAKHIGPYLRTLIREHHDTLTNLIK